MKDKNSGREASIDRLIAGTLKARAEAAEDAACLDPETLAAWADGALDVRERARAEAHAADCGRCQALLAAMVRTTPPPSAAAAPFRTRLLWWLAPIAPVAAAVAIWFAVPSRAPLQQSDSGAVAVEHAVPAPRPEVAADAKVKAQSGDQPQTQVANKRKAAPAPVFAPPPVDLRERRQEAPVQKQAAPAAPASANALADAAKGAPASPPPAAAAEAGPRREAFAAASRLSGFANAPEMIIVSSNPSTRFRLLRGGGVQRSSDAGATWQTEVTGITDTLTAGSSPSPSVCWLIGPSGTVLLSTDGRSWRRVQFPERVDLRVITASDSDHATVTTADGRVFVTADGGQRWERVLGF